MPDLQLIDSLSLRHLKAARCVADHNNVTRAAGVLNLTQSAVTKALNQLEGQLGTRLFDRSPRGVQLTAQGEVFIARIREAEDQFRIAEVAWSKLRGVTNATNNPVFSFNISRKRLSAFLVLFETGDFSATARQLEITRTAVYSSIRHLEKYLELRLFENVSSRLVWSTYGEILATQVKLAFASIRHGIEEVFSVDGATQGRVVVGALPYSRTFLVPRTIQCLLDQFPQLQIATREGPYDILESALRSGDIDLIVGATRQHPDSSTLTTENLFEDELAIISRVHHPVTRIEQLTLNDLMRYGWILPPEATPARQLFNQLLNKEGVPTPREVIETSSLSTIRGLLLDSDRIALLSTHQVHYDEQAGLLITLPVKLEGTFRPIGATFRTNTILSPAARLFLEALRRTAEQLS